MTIAGLSPQIARAQDYTEVKKDGITYRIQGDSAIVFSADTISVVTANIPSEVNGVPVTTIGWYAFSRCNNLTSVIIPNSVNSISEYAFNDCSSLKSISIPNSVTVIRSHTFYLCSGLTSVTIPNSVTTIEEAAFWGCKSLTSITIPEDVTTIKGYVFKYSGLEEVFFNAKNCANCVYDRVFGGVFPAELKRATIGENVQRIPDNLFKGCDNLENVFLNAENCTESGYSTFPSTLKNVTIGDNVKTIPGNAFYGCSSLTSITIPQSVTSIGRLAFDSCSSMDEVFFNADNCTKCESSFPSSIKYLSIGDNVKTIPEIAFRYCRGLTSITIPNSVISIGKKAFSGCSGLTSVTIPNSVTSIGGYAFDGCNKLEEVFFNAENCADFGYYENVFPRTLKKVIIGNNVKRIPGFAFYNYSALTEITIPKSVIEVGKSAFVGCTGLDVVNTQSLEAWLNIEFVNEWSNPTYCAKKLLVDGQTIRRLSIPEGTERINAYAFINCEPLVTVTINGSGQLSIGERAFDGCTGLQRAIFPSVDTFISVEYDNEESLFTNGNDSKIYIGSTEFDKSSVKEYSWPETLTRIPACAFLNYTELENIRIPETVVEIGNRAFSGCSKLPDIQLPSGLVNIGKEAFSKCSGLTSVTIPEHVTTIGYNAFSFCSGLQEVFFNAENCNEGRHIFANSSLNVLTIGDNVKTIPEYAFYGCRSLNSVTFGKSVASIGASAFSDCRYLTDIRIDNEARWAKIDFGNEYSNPMYYAGKFSVGDSNEPMKNLNINLEGSSVSNYAFVGADCLENVKVKAASVGNEAFSACEGLKQIFLDTDSVGEYAFKGCTSMEKIYCNRPTPPTASDYSFDKYAGVSLYVPAGAVSAYENADVCWWRFLDVYESNFDGLDGIFGDETNSVTDVAVDNSSAPVEVYNLSGMRVGKSTEGLAPGIYIVRQGTETKKIRVI